jgi:hypothetical protein
MRAARIRSRWVVLGVVVTAMGIGEAPASAAERVDRFEGSCSLEGRVEFSPPATNEQQSLEVRTRAGGTCSGKLNGRTISNAPVRLRSLVREVDGSCRRADTTRPGHGAIVFANGVKIRYRFEFHFVGAHGTLSFRGQRSGSAQGVGSLLTPRTPPDVADRCAGEGVARTPIDLSLATDSPLTSRRRD